MQVYLAGAVGLLGVILVVAGVRGNGPNLFTAVTGVGVKAGSGTSGAAYTPAPGTRPAMPALGPTGPGRTGAVIYA